jgi:glycosyltransferase involved in cell wall biosynthesis
MRIALLFRSYGPYHLARLRALREIHSVLALEFSPIDEDYDWDTREQKRGSNIVSLSTTSTTEARPRAQFMEKLAGELTRFSPDAVAIPGYSEPFAMAALRICQALDIPAILMSDTHAGSTRPNIGRKMLKKQLLPLYHSALVAGTPHADYLKSLGFPGDKIATGYDVVDNDHFSRPVRGHASATRRPENLPPSFFFCCARLIGEKNLEFLIEAFHQYRRHTPHDAWDLLIAGDGPLREAIARRASELAVAPHVNLSGHKSYQDLPALYNAAATFILPSRSDTWGLVVNEAMAAGLPVLVSTATGCHRDLVENGINGFVFDPKNVDELAKLMSKVAMSGRRREMGEASRRIIAQWDLGRFASGLTTAAEMAQKSRPRRGLRVGGAVATALSYRI